MPSSRQPSVVMPGPGKLAAGQVPASALGFAINESELAGKVVAVSTRTAQVTPGAPVASVVLPANTYVGDSNTYPLGVLFDVVDSADRAILNAGSRVVVTSISGATVGDGFTTGAVTLNLTPSIPTGTTYQVYYAARNTLGSLPTDAMAFDPVHGMYAAGVAYGGSGNWSDGAGTPTASQTVEAAVDGIVSDLAASTGANRVGASVTSTWANTNTVASTNTGAALNEIVSDLADASNILPQGSRKVGYFPQAAVVWADTNQALTSTTVGQAIDEVVGDLAANSALGNQGSRRVGYFPQAAVVWADTNQALTSTTVGQAIDEVVGDLAANAGADRVGVDGSTFSGALTASGGGGVSTGVSSIQLALDALDLAVVARRTHRSVYTDGVASFGGDTQSANLDSILAPVSDRDGSYLLRRGTYTATVDMNSSTNLQLVGEFWETGLGGVLVSTTRTNQAVYSHASGQSRFENIHFTTTGGVREWDIYGTRVSLENCQADAGTFVVRDSSVNLDKFRVVSSGSGSTNTFGVQFRDSPSGTVKNLDLLKVPGVAATSQDSLHLYSGYHSGAPLTFEGCNIVANASSGFTAGGNALHAFSWSQNTVFRGCSFTVSGPSSVTVARLVNAHNITFEDCVFTQDSDGQVLYVDPSSTGITFTRCKFYTSLTTVSPYDLVVMCSNNYTYSTFGAASPVKFKDCYVEIRKGDGTFSRRLEFGSLGGTPTGGGPIQIDGLRVVLNYSGSSPLTLLNDRLFTYTNGVNLEQTDSLVKNITFDLRGKTLAQIGAHPIEFNGHLGGLVRVNDLYVIGVAEPVSPATANTCSLVSLQKANVCGGGIEAVTTDFSGTVVSTSDPASVIPYLSIFSLVDDGTAFEGSCVEKVRFYTNFAVGANKAVPRGRLFYLSGSRNKVINNEVFLSVLHPLEDHDGWFSYSSGAHNTVRNNTVYVATVDNTYMPVSNALITLNASSDYNTVTGNMGQIASANYTAFIKLVGNCDVNNLTANTFRILGVAATNVDLLVLSATATQNVIGDNTLWADDGTCTSRIQTNGSGGTNLINNNRVGAVV
jgi:hypothetical protein